MKWIGQHIWSLISRFRSDVYLEDLSETTQDHVVSVDADGKLYKQDKSTGDITSVSLVSDSGTINALTGAASFTIEGGSNITTSATGSTLTINGQPGDIEAIGLTGDDGNEIIVSSGSARFNIFGGDAIDTTAVGSTISINVAQGSETVRGVLELATSDEAIAGVDEQRAVTPAGLRDHVSTKYAYQYIMFHASDAIKSNWITFGQNGLTNHTWGTNTSDSGVTVGSSTMACTNVMQASGFKIPYACKLIGFYGTGYRYGGSNTFAAGVFILDSPDYNSAASGGNVDTVNATLRAYADAAQDGSTGFNQRLNKIVDTARSYDCPAGSMIFPAFKDTAGVDSGSFRGNMTIILATPIVTIA